MLSVIILIESIKVNKLMARFFLNFSPAQGLVVFWDDGQGLPEIAKKSLDAMLEHLQAKPVQRLPNSPTPPHVYLVTDFVPNSIASVAF
jgi:hypothetical protein